MKLNKNSYHYKWYVFLKGEEPNKNFCDYFWTLFFYTLLFPIIYPWYIIYSFQDKKSYEFD